MRIVVMFYGQTMGVASVGQGVSCPCALTLAPQLPLMNIVGFCKCPHCDKLPVS